MTTKEGNITLFTGEEPPVPGPQLLTRRHLLTLPPVVQLSNGEFPGGKLGLNRILSDPGLSDADNGMPDL